MEKIRLQKWMSEQGICSRRNAEEMIRERRIRINGQTAKLGDKVGSDDVIAVNNKEIKPKESKKEVVIAYFKPIGVECTYAKIEGQITLADIDFGNQRVFAVGRLDKESQGLLLLTNNGDLANKLAHPRFQKEKEYLVSVSTEVASNQLQKLQAGIQHGKDFLKAEVKLLEPELLNFKLKEGRNRHIRKMCEGVDLKVIDLLRIRIGKLNLGEMKPGKWRVLSETEINSL